MAQAILFDFRTLWGCWYPRIWTVMHPEFRKGGHITKYSSISVDDSVKNRDLYFKCKVFRLNLLQKMVNT